MRRTLSNILVSIILYESMALCLANADKKEIKEIKERGSIPTECLYKGTEYTWEFAKKVVPKRVILVMNITKMYTNPRDFLIIYGQHVQHSTPAPSCYIILNNKGESDPCTDAITNSNNLRICYKFVVDTTTLYVTYQTEDEVVSNDDFNIEYQFLTCGKTATTSTISEVSMNCKSTVGPKTLFVPPLSESVKQETITAVTITTVPAKKTSSAIKEIEDSKQKLERTTDTSPNNDQEIHIALIIAIVVAVFFFIAFVLVIACLCVLRGRKAKRSNLRQPRPVDTSYQEPSFIDHHHSETTPKTFVTSSSHDRSDIVSDIFDDSFHESVSSDSEFYQPNTYENMPSSSEPRYENATTDMTRDQSKKYLSMMALKPQYLEMNSVTRKKFDETTYYSIKERHEYQNTFTNGTKPQF